MNLLNTEKLEKSIVSIQFSVEAEKLNKAAAAVFKRDAKKYSVPGFRKGKAPRHLIEKMYGADVFLYDALNDIFGEEYEAAVKAAGLEVVGQPDVSVDSISAAEGAVVTAKVPVKPEVKVSGYTGLTAEKKAVSVDEADVDAELKRMQDRGARECTREGAAQDGDTVDIDFEGFVDGVPFEGGKDEHYKLTLGSNSFIPGFEAQIVGHAAGEEFDIDVTFPEQYAAELAGKAAVFHIVLHEVKYKELPELDDDFAADVSEYDTLEALKESIRKQKLEQLQKQADLDVENALVDQVVAGMEADIPQAMYDERCVEMANEYAYRLEQSGLHLADYLKYVGQTAEQFRAGFMPQAEKQVKIRLALEAVAKAEGLTASDDDVAAEYQRIAEQYSMEVDKVKELVNEADLRNDLAVTKAIDFIKSKAVITTAEAAPAAAETAEAAVEE